MGNAGEWMCKHVHLQGSGVLECSACNPVSEILGVCTLLTLPCLLPCTLHMQIAMQCNAHAIAVECRGKHVILQGIVFRVAEHGSSGGFFLP